MLDEGQKLTSAHGKNATKNVSDIYKAKAKKRHAIGRWDRCIRHNLAPLVEQILLCQTGGILKQTQQFF